ncbi:unnamed protein product, partial [Laminaria digitata]
QLAHSLPGTVVFFDKFCPDLHNLPDVGEDDDGTTSGTTSGIASGIASGVTYASLTGTGDADHASPLRDAAASSSSSFSSLAAACRWCGVELGNSSVTILSDDNAENNDYGDGNADEEGYPAHGQAVGGAGRGEGGRGDGGVPVLGLHGFLRRFVDESGAEDLARRGDLLRKVHLSNKVATPTSTTSEGGSKEATPPLATPHPSKTQLAALVAGGQALKGKLDVFDHNPKEGVVLVGAGGSGGGVLEEWTDDGGRTKVLVVGKDGMNRAMHGDTVAVTLLPKRRWRAPADRNRLTHVNEEDSGVVVGEEDNGLGLGDDEGNVPPGAMPTGFVVGVMEEGRRPYVVTIPPEETGGLGGGGGAGATVAAVPMDPRIPKIRIKTRQLAQISGQRLVAMVDSWDVGHVFPSGHYVASLGPVGEVSSEAAALLVECEARFEPFSFNALASLPIVPNPPEESQKPTDALLPPATLAERERPAGGFGKASSWQDSGWRVQAADVVGRRDLRGERVMSVDPPGCQDIDDAMHVTRKPNGKLEIGVHIADVTRFLEADGPLDKEARARATTVYLVHRRIDMLPALLSSDLCSLHAGTDRLSVSVVWEAEEDGEDIRLCTRPDGSPVCWFGRTAIHSRASMTYDQAQMLVEEGKITRPRRHEQPPLGQAGRDVDDALQPGLTGDLRLLTRLAR